MTGLPVSLFTNSTQAILYNFKDVPVQSMLDFDYVSRRKTPSIAGTGFAPFSGLRSQPSLRPFATSSIGMHFHGTAMHLSVFAQVPLFPRFSFAKNLRLHILAAFLMFCGTQFIGLVKPGAYPGSHHKVFFGQEEILLPIYGSIQRAVSAHPNADVFINYASSRFVYFVVLLTFVCDNSDLCVFGCPQKRLRVLKGGSRG